MSKIKKKIIFCCVLIILVFMLCGCSDSNSSNNWHAILLMPDGSIIKGFCNNYLRFNNNWMKVIVDGIEYRLSDYRVILIKEP